MIRLTPQSGESQADFCERCHKELEGQIPETDRRNGICLQMCRDAGFDGPQRFSEREFQIVKDVPVFAEHTTKDRAGNLVVYDRNALAAIASRCNDRISDTGDYPPITEGHTPTKEDMAQGARMPDVLGYAANFRLGQIGNQNPRWAIFCDEYHHREDAQKLRKLRRRSPEVWLEERMEDRFFDPIAALGAETPRLDMGMARFARTQDGRVVEKYTAVAPSATSAFVPGEEKSYQSDNAEGIAMLGPDDINQIVEAMMQTEPMQWVQQQMGAGVPGEEGGIPGEAPPGPDAGGMPPADPSVEPPAAPAAPPAAPAEPAAAPPYEPDEEDQQQFSRYMAGDVDDEEMAAYAAEKRKKKNRFYAAGCDPDSNDETGDSDMTDDYAKKHEERIEKAKYAKLESEVQELKAKAAKADEDRRKAERYSKLNDMRQAGFQLDPTKEMERTADYSDAQFDKHLDCITDNYSRIPLNGVVPSLYVPAGQTVAHEDQEKKAKYAKEAQKRVLQARDRGQNLDYVEALEAVKKEAVA